MRAVAAVATACLLASGCSWIAKRPGASSVVADLSFTAAAYVIASDQLCGIVGPEDSTCEYQGYATVVVGLPLVLVGSIAGSHAMASPPANAEDSHPTWDGRLPPTTDAVTRRFAFQARAAVRAGQCEAARATLELIAARDAEYHIALLAKGVLGACL